MSGLRAVLTAFVVLVAPPVYAASEDAAPPIQQKVHLIRTTIGCGTYDGLVRIAYVLNVKGPDAAMPDSAAADCHVITTFRGPIIDAKNLAICVLGLGNTRCLWFSKSNFEPTDH